KETAFPFFVLLGIAGTFCNAAVWTERAAMVKRVAVLIAAASSAVIVNAAFNYVRFGTVANRAYLDPTLIVSSTDQLSFFAGLWASPNGGVLVFCPAFAVLLIYSA